MTTVGMISRSIFLLLCLCGQVACQPRVDPVGISPPHPLVNNSVTLRCQASDFDPSFHNFTWKKSAMGSTPAVSVTANGRVSISPIRSVLGLTGEYFQTLIIKSLRESDEGSYHCFVIESGSGNTIAQGQGDLLVYRPQDFPVCSPDGPVEIKEGDTLSCKTVDGGRVPVVQAAGDPQGTNLDWMELSPDGGTGLELQHSAGPEDNGHTFVCFSTASNSRKVPSCTIGPLTFNPQEPECYCSSTNLSPVSVACVAVAACVIVAAIFMNICCCQYNSRRWRQFLGLFACKEELEQHQNQYESSIRAPQTTVHTQNIADATSSGSPYTSIGVEATSKRGTSDVTVEQGTAPGNTGNVKKLPSIKNKSGMTKKPTRDSEASAADYELPTPGTHEGSASSKPTDAYMELQGKPNTAMYTDLKL